MSKVKGPETTSGQSQATGSGHSGVERTRERRNLGEVALGRRPADLVVRGGRLVEVHTGTVIEADVALAGGRIAAVGSVAQTIGEETRIHDASGCFLLPGFIDCHMHAPESQLTMTELARLLNSLGTAAIGTCFYEAGTIAGLEGIRFFLEEARKTPLKVYLSPFISSYRGLGRWGNPGRFKGADLLELLDEPECIEIREWSFGVEESADDAIDAFVACAREQDKLLAGHLAGHDDYALQASAALGVSSDHEILTAQEAIDRARLGIRVQIRQGSYSWDLDAVLEAVTKGRVDSRYFMFCTDGVEAHELATKGHIDHILRSAVDAGLDPVTAVQMATLNAAEYLGVTSDLGSIAPGRFGHVNVIEDLESFRVRDVIADGALILSDGGYGEPAAQPAYPDRFRDTVHIGRELSAGDFAVPSGQVGGTVEVRAIGVRPGTIDTEEQMVVLPIRAGLILPDPQRDVAKLCVLDRHTASGRIGHAFIAGLGIERGAITTTMSPAMMNMMVVGIDDDDMALSANRGRELGGGLVAALDGEVVAEVPLPILGVVSDARLEQLLEQVAYFEEIRQRRLGSGFPGLLTVAGFTMMAVHLPGLRLSDRGLVRVTPQGQELVPLTSGTPQDATNDRGNVDPGGPRVG